MVPLKLKEFHSMIIILTTYILRSVPYANCITNAVDLISCTCSADKSLYSNQIVHRDQKLNKSKETMQKDVIHKTIFQ